MQETLETQVQSRGREAPLEEKMATHSRILAWEIPWTEEPWRLQSVALQRVGHDQACTHTRSRQSGEEKGSFTGGENGQRCWVPVLRGGSDEERGSRIGRSRSWVTGLHLKIGKQPFQVLSAGTICQTYPWGYYSRCAGENEWSRKQAFVTVNQVRIMMACTRAVRVEGKGGI